MSLLMALKKLLFFLIFLFLLVGCSEDNEPVISGNVSNEYSIYDGKLIKFKDFPIGSMINSFILEVENMLFEVDAADFEKYGRGRMVEITYLNTDGSKFKVIESIANDGKYTLSTKQRSVYGIVSITGVETEQTNTKEIIKEEKHSNNLEEEKKEESVDEVHVNQSTATSSDGSYRIESFGMIKDITAGGLYPAEGIRLVEIETGQELWSMSPGYYAQTYLWSPNNRYVAVYAETRISGETFIVDTKTMTKILLPNIEQVRIKLNTNMTVNESRPDPDFRFINWLDDDHLSVAFQWTGIGSDGYEGIYIHNITDNKLSDIKLN
jgi:hypothetical protein